MKIFTIPFFCFIVSAGFSFAQEAIPGAEAKVFEFAYAVDSYYYEARSYGQETTTVTEGPALASGSWTIDYATPDYATADPSVGRYIGGLFRTPLYSEPGEPQNFVTGMAARINGSPFGDLTYVSQAARSDSSEIVYYSPHVFVTNGTATETTIEGVTIPVGSDILQFSFLRQTSTSRGGSEDRMTILLVDTTGGALADDRLPTAVDIAAYDIARVFNVSGSSGGSGTTASRGEQWRQSGNLTAFGTEVIPPPPTFPSLTVTASATPENAGSIAVTFSLSAPAITDSGFNFSLRSLDPRDDEAGPDFVFPLPTDYIRFLPGETTKTEYLPLVDDSLVEGEEYYVVELTKPSGVILPLNFTILTILDNDVAEERSPVLTASSSPTNEGLIGLEVVFELSKAAAEAVSVGFDTVGGTANPLEDFRPWTNGVMTFAPGETRKTLLLTMIDDAIIEPHETYSLRLKDAAGLTFFTDSVVLTILNDDTAFDNYGVQFGLPPEDRQIHADGDGDGVGFFLEYTFRLDPTVAARPDYVPGRTYEGDEQPTGLPVIVTDGDVVKYVFIRRTDAYPWIEYFAEISTDGVNFEPTTPDKVTRLTEHWEEVEIILSGPGKETPSCFARVRVEAYGEVR